MAMIEEPASEEFAPVEQRGHDGTGARSGPLLAAAVVLAVLVGFGFGWLAFRDGEDDASAIELARDELIEQQSERRDKSVAVNVAIRAVLDDPESYGTEDEVADLLATYATPSAQMDDDVFGAVNMRQAWYNTLYDSAMDSEIDVWHQWVADDGSQSSSLWVWHGTNFAGNPFELVGIAIDDHDEEGLVTHEFVVYPYPDDYVDNAVFGSGNK